MAEHFFPIFTYSFFLPINRIHTVLNLGNNMAHPWLFLSQVLGTAWRAWAAMKQNFWGCQGVFLPAFHCADIQGILLSWVASFKHLLCYQDFENHKWWSSPFLRVVLRIFQIGLFKLLCSKRCFIFNLINKVLKQVSPKNTSFDILIY